MECIVKCKKKKIAAGDVTWSESEDSLGMEFSFTLPYSYFDDQFDTVLTVGDQVAIYVGGSKVLEGIITETPLHGSDYKGYDYAFYLNKSTTIIQFKKVGASTAIKQICKKFDVPVGTMPSMATSISKLYKNENVADIINDILKKVKNETGKKYKMQMKDGKLNIIEKGTTKIKPTYKDELGRTVQCQKASSISGTRSIEELKNSILVAGTGDDSKQLKATAEDKASIKKYGRLQTVELEDDLNSAKARNRAANLLKENNKVTTSFTAEMPGNTKIRASVRIYFERPEAHIKGWYKVKSCTHTITGNGYRVSCEMEN